jgi:predicted small lipoprotein YifL
MMRILGIMLLLLVAMQGCGRKGGLYLPPPSKPADAQTVPDQSQPKKQP